MTETNLPPSWNRRIAEELLRRWNVLTGFNRPFPKWPIEPVPASQFFLTDLSILILDGLAASQQYVRGRAGMFRAFMEYRPLATIDDVGPEFVKGYQEFRKNRSYHPKGPTVGPLTISRELKDVRAFIRRSFERGAVQEHVTYKVSNVKDNREADLSDRAVYYLLLAAEKLPVAIRTYLIIDLFTGQRTAAVMELDWEQVDFERNVIDFDKPNLPENNKNRHIVEMAKPLRDFLLEQRRLSSGAGRIIRVGRGYIAQRQPWIQTAIDEAAILAAAEIDFSVTDQEREENRQAAEELGKATPHYLRHKVISKLIEAGVSAKDVGAFIGHANPATTERYIHVPASKIAECARILERRFLEASKRLDEALGDEAP